MSEMKMDAYEKKIEKEDLMKFLVEGKLSIENIAELCGLESRQFVLYKQIKKFLKVFKSLCNLFKDTQNPSEKVAIGRELREYIKLIVSLYEKEIIEEKERKLEEIKRAYKEKLIE